MRTTESLNIKPINLYYLNSSRHFISLKNICIIAVSHVLHQLLQFNNEITKHQHHKTAKICFLKIQGNSSKALKFSLNTNLQHQ